MFVFKREVVIAPSVRDSSTDSGVDLSSAPNFAQRPPRGLPVIKKTEISTLFKILFRKHFSDRLFTKSGQFQETQNKRLCIHEYLYIYIKLI